MVKVTKKKPTKSAKSMAGVSVSGAERKRVSTAKKKPAKSMAGVSVSGAERKRKAKKK